MLTHLTQDAINYTSCDWVHAHGLRMKPRFRYK